MTMVRSFKGRMVDMGALAAANSHVRAVGNANLNARGDRLDAKGNIVKSAEAIDAERLAYNRENPNAVSRQLPLSALDVEVYASASDVFKKTPEIAPAITTEKAEKKAAKKIISSEE